MTIEQVDNVTLLAFVAAIAVNRQAALLVLAHIASELIYNATDSGIYYNAACGVMYAVIGASFITIKYRLRQVFIAVGALFWLSALDFYLFPNAETLYYNSFAYLVGALDLYALYLLLGGWRLDRINGTASGNSNIRIFNLQLLQARIAKGEK